MTINNNNNNNNNNNGSSTPGSNTTVPSNTEDSNKQISSLNLEPNPFEQSFASTKKPFDPMSNNSNNTTNGLLSTAGSPSSLLNLVNSKQNIPRNNSISTQRSFHRGSIPNGISNLPIGSASSTNLLFSGQRPVIHSPPMLTPGGSKRLPPLISPNYGSTLQQQQQQQQPQMSPDAGMAGTATALNSNNNSTTMISSLINNGTITTKPNGIPGPGTPGFLSYLPRSGLTPNESSIRSGLTPGALTAPFNYPMLPALSAGGTTTTAATTVRAGQPLTPGMSAIFNNVAPIASDSKLVTNVDGLVPHVKEEDQTISMSTTGNKNKKNTVTRRKRANSTKNETSTKTKKKSKNDKDIKIKNESKQKSLSKVSVEEPSNNDNALKDIKNDLDNDEPLDPEQEEQKRKEFLERNRVAASKFRKRKKEYIKKIEEDLNFYENEYNEMSNTLFKLLPPTDSMGSDSHNSYIPMLEDSIRKNDINSALTLLSHVRQLLTRTKIYQRKGENPLGNDLQMVKENTKKPVTNKKDSISISQLQQQQHNVASIQSSMSPPSMSSYLPTGMISQVSPVATDNTIHNNSLSSINDKPTK